MSSNKVAGRRLREHRVNLGLSPEAFGARIGVSGMTVRRIEDGYPLRVRTAFLIAQELEVDVIHLWPPPATRRAVAA